MQQYNKPIQKIINFDDVTKENIRQDNPIGHNFLIIHAEY